MLNPANIYRSKRRTLSLYIDPNGELIVKAPLNLSERKIFDFVKEKQDWIRARQAQIMKNSYINRDVVSYNMFLYLGRELIPVISADTREIIKSDGSLLIPAKLDQFKILKKVEKWLRACAQSVIRDRADYFSQVLKLAANSIGTNNNKTRWGSCSRDGNIAINWRAIMLKPELLDYIIVHEFCHLLEFNHTKNFWSVVQTILPGWRSLRTQLKQMNWILQLFRTN